DSSQREAYGAGRYRVAADVPADLAILVRGIRVLPHHDAKVFAGKTLKHHLSRDAESLGAEHRSTDADHETGVDPPRQMERVVYRCCLGPQDQQRLPGDLPQVTAGAEAEEGRQDQPRLRSGLCGGRRGIPQENREQDPFHVPGACTWGWPLTARPSSVIPERFAISTAMLEGTDGVAT